MKVRKVKSIEQLMEEGFAFNEYGQFENSEYVVRRECLCLLGREVLNIPGKEDYYLYLNCRHKISSYLIVQEFEEYKIDMPVWMRSESSKIKSDVVRRIFEKLSQCEGSRPAGFYEWLIDANEHTREVAAKHRSMLKNEN